MREKPFFRIKISSLLSKWQSAKDVFVNDARHSGEIIQIKIRPSLAQAFAIELGFVNRKK